MLLLLAPVVAMAGDEDAAEYRRLTESMTKLAERNAWEGVERNYVGIIELDHDIEARVHRLGAQSARSLGNVGDQVERLRAAEALEATTEGKAELDGILAAYGPVKLHIRKGEADGLAVRERPFQPDLGKAIDEAAKVVASSGSFEGWIPAGEYTLGPKTFVVKPGGEPVTVDLRKELAGEGKCTKVTSEELLQALTMATSAYGQEDWPGFTDAAREARQMTPCVTDEIPDHVAARFHLVTALEAHHNKNNDLALAAATVARFEAPKYELPTATVKEGDAFRGIWDDAKKVKSGALSADKPAEGYLLFDGHRRTWRYEGHPVVFQLVDDDGKVTNSSYIVDSVELPAYTPLPEGEKSAYSYEDEGSLRGPLLVGAGATALIAGTLYGLGASKRAAFKNSDDVSELAGLHSQANAFGSAGVAAGVVAVGFGVGAVLTKSF